MVAGIPHTDAKEEHAGRTPLYRRWLRAFLAVPLFYKILVANAVIVLLAALGGAVFAEELVGDQDARITAEAVGLLALGWMTVSVLLNAVILKLALIPLGILEQAAGRVQKGDLDARAPLSPLADRELGRLTRIFNAMLDNLARHRERVREVAARALREEEEERQRIARELHEETAQGLAALLIRLRVAQQKQDPQSLGGLLEEARQEIARALEMVRGFARELRPQALDQLGLVAALESHARSVTQSGGLAVRVEATPIDGLVSSEAELALYRIVEEALSNAVRHAWARKARVGIQRVPGRVVVTVEDDGLGFPVAQVMAGRSQGLGLIGMQERAACLGGKVEITSEPGSGTWVRAEFPVRHANAHT